MRKINISDYINNLPSEAKYTVKSGLKWKEKYIGNIMLSVHTLLKYITNNGTIEDWLTVEAILGDDIIDTLTVKESDINDIDWGSTIRGFIPSPDCPKANSYYITVVKYQATKCTNVIHCFQVEQTGFVKITLPEIEAEEEVYCYNTGAGLILPENSRIDDIVDRIKIKNPESEWRLNADTKRYSEDEALAGMVKAISLYPNVGRSVVAFIIAALLKSVLRECGISPKFILYICGLRGRKKTAYISLLTPFFSKYGDVSKLILQFNSTDCPVDELLSKLADFVIVLDNVYASENSDINGRIKKKFEEVAQVVGDDVVKRKAHKQYAPLASIIATGEYNGIGNASTIARYLSIPFGDDLKTSNNEILLHECQSEAMVISTFYWYFLQWVVNNVKVIKSSIKDLLTDFRASSDKLNIDSKLKERYFVLRISYMLFLKYCGEKGILTKDKMGRLDKEFSELLMWLCKRHNKTVTEKDRETERGTDDFLPLINYLYTKNKFDLTKSDDPKKIKQHDGFVHDDCLCLLSEKLTKKINVRYPHVQVKEITEQLAQNGITIHDKDKNTGERRGLRVVIIPLAKLRDV
jgi:hypothetical protein